MHLNEAAKEIEMVRTIRRKADMSISEKIDNRELKDRELVSVAKDYFNREQLLLGRPTVIAEELSNRSDEELIKELDDPAIRDYLIRAAKRDTKGTEEEATGGADKILEAPQSTEEVHSQ